MKAALMRPKKLILGCQDESSTYANLGLLLIGLIMLPFQCRTSFDHPIWSKFQSVVTNKELLNMQHFCIIFLYECFLVFPLSTMTL